ncbi:hypothetical protein AB0J09_12545, partial [Nonomuraea sp. NPDC049784]
PGPLRQRLAFGGGTVPAPAAPPVQNGTFRSFGSFESFDGGGRPSGPSPRHGYRPPQSTPEPRSYDSAPFQSDPGKTGVNGFTADTDGGSYRRQSASFDSGAYPSFPNAGSYPSGNGAFQTPPPAPSYPTNDVRRPDPTPSVDVSPMEAEREEYLPIFASVESAWFRRPPNETAGEVAPQSAGGGEGKPSQAVPSGEEAWRTAADAGWRAAAAAAEPSLGGITAAGLPKRTPKANLVPGTANQPAQPQQPQRPAPTPPISADRMRSRMASYQQGVRRGRQEVRGQEEQSE